MALMAVGANAQTLIAEKDWTGGFEGDYPMWNQFADGQEGVIFYSLSTIPDIPVYDLDGNYSTTVREGYTSANPVALAMQN